MSPNDSQANGDASAAGLPLISPDFVEEQQGDQFDNIVSVRGYHTTPMVGLGGSAGSIPVLNEFFKAMPPTSGFVFVVVLHLSPTHDSIMAEVLGRSTSMPVFQAEDGQKVQPNHVYVIPPGKHLIAVDGHLKLAELDSERGLRVAVDLFFRSLADTHGPRAAAIVLSGADGDGAIGIKRIKERGGLTIVQDPDEAGHSDMPRASIDTGMVDWVLDVKQIPIRLLDYFHRQARLKLPPEEGPPPASAPPTLDEGEAALREVLVYLRMRTGGDFFYYKRATILRRIARRMEVNAVEDLPAYLNFLRTHPGESGALLQDLLISVTNFFRDREAFAALEEYLPALFNNKTQADSVRAWVPACATGEEAYSIAMLFLEHASKLDAPPSVNVFDLMEVSRITRGKIDLRKECVDLASVLRSAVETSKPLIDAAGHSFALELPDEPLFLLVDPVRMSQVFANLINNSAKYTENGGRISVSARTRPSIRRPSEGDAESDVKGHVSKGFTQQDRPHR